MAKGKHFTDHERAVNRIMGVLARKVMVPSNRFNLDFEDFHNIKYEVSENGKVYSVKIMGTMFNASSIEYWWSHDLTLVEPTIYHFKNIWVPGVRSQLHILRPLFYEKRPPTKRAWYRIAEFHWLDPERKRNLPLDDRLIGYDCLNEEYPLEIRGINPSNR